MGITVVKGQKADLTKGNPELKALYVELGWQPAGGLEMDSSAFLLDGGGKVSGDEDLIFYNNRSAPFIRYNDSSPGLRGFEVELDHIPSRIARIAFTLTIDEGESRGRHFGQLERVYLRLLDGRSRAEILRCDLEHYFSVETAVVAGELYRLGADWKFGAIASGFSGGLGALCGNFGLEVEESPDSAALRPPVRDMPGNPAEPLPGLHLKKIELKKKGDMIDLKKPAKGLGEIPVNLNWNTRRSGGVFGRGRGIDLDLACLYELKDGRKGVVQALGQAFGSFERAPYVSLDGDDRTGSVEAGENLRINGTKIAEIERILVFSFIYEGAMNWSEADGVVTIRQGDGPDIAVSLDEHDNRKGMCAIALIRNVKNETFSVERLVQYFRGHREMDEAYRWGLRWVAGQK